MIFSQLLLIGSTVALGSTDPWEHPWHTAMLACLVAFCSATQDIVIDAYRVEILDKDQQGPGAGIIVFGYRVGMLVSSMGALYLANSYNWFAVYILMATCIAVGIITVLLTGEPKSSAIEARTHAKKESVRDWLNRGVVMPFADFLHRRGWMTILLFILFFKFGDALAGVMTNTFFLEVGFSKKDIADIGKLYGFIATIIGSMVGGVMVYRIGLVKSLWIGGSLQLLSNLMFALQAVVGYDKGLLAITVGFENFSGGMGNAAFVAYLSSLCNISYTATQYALLSSFSAMGRTWLSASSGYMVEQWGWVQFFLFSTAAAIPGLIFLSLMMRLIPQTVILKDSYGNKSGEGG